MVNTTFLNSIEDPWLTLKEGEGGVRDKPEGLDSTHEKNGQIEGAETEIEMRTA